MVLLKFLIIPAMIITAHYTSWITYSILQNLKNGSYVVPIFGWRFEHWFSFVVGALAIMQIFYLISGIILFTAYKLTLDHFQVAYPAVVLNLLAVVLWTILMMYVRVREIPTRDGWIAIALIIIASLLAMNAGKNIKS